MNSDNVVKHARALWRTNRIIADIRLRHLVTGLGLRAFAALIAVFGLGMLELGAYFALIQPLNPIYAAVILGLVNFAIAAVLFAVAARPPAGRELELANEIHDSSMEGLQQEARALQSEISGMIQHPLNGVLPMLVIPLITMIVKALRQHSSAKPAPVAAAAESVAEEM